MNDKRGTTGNGHDRIVGPVETRLKLRKDLPTAEPPESRFHAMCGPIPSALNDTSV
jgi:hypothetical protein